MSSEGARPPRREPDGRSTDSVAAYLQQIGTIPLLTAEDEVRLAKAIEAGLLAQWRLDQVAEATADPQSARRDAELELLVAEGRRATRAMVEANLRLVVSIARRYVGRGVSLLDLIQEGNLGLIRAVEKFDYTRGFKFSTYATWWIRQAVTRALADQSRTIRLPVHVTEEMNRVLRVRRELTQATGGTPTAEEIGLASGVDTQRVEELLRLVPEPVSLSLPVGDESATELGELIEDAEATLPDEVATTHQLRTFLDEVLDTLGDRERRMVRLRYGLEDGYAHTLEDVGESFGVTRERVRQIESRTLAKLRRGRYAEGLHAFLEE